MLFSLQVRVLVDSTRECPPPRRLRKCVIDVTHWLSARVYLYLSVVVRCSCTAPPGRRPCGAGRVRQAAGFPLVRLGQRVRQAEGGGACVQGVQVRGVQRRVPALCAGAFPPNPCHSVVVMAEGIAPPTTLPLLVHPINQVHVHLFPCIACGTAGGWLQGQALVGVPRR